MIDETTLTNALEEAASAYDEPPGARAAILAAATSAPARDSARGAPRSAPAWRRPFPLGAAAAAVVLVGAVAIGASVSDDRVNRLSSPISQPVGPTDTARSVDEFAEVALVAPRAGRAPAAGTSGTASGTAGGSGTSGSGGGGSGAPPAPAAQPAESLAKVVKTGSVEIVVADGKVPATLARLETLVLGARGFVAESKTQESGDSPSGIVTMRVPGASYEAVLGRVRTLGEVRTATSTGEDVTAAFVDTEARLRTLKQTRGVYETLMARARSIGEVLAVQQQINGAQTQIEQLEGKLKVLRDQVSYATLTVSVFEESDELATLQEPGRLASSWDRAKDNFGDGIEWLVAASGTVALLVIAGGLLLIVGLGVRRLLRRRLI